MGSESPSYQALFKTWRETAPEVVVAPQKKNQRAASTPLELEIRFNELGQKVLYFPFISVSDIHLGTRHCRAKRLAHFLEHTKTDHMKAVGDVVDLEDMVHKQRWNFAPWHRQVLAHLLRKEAQVYAGNHDEAPRGKRLVRNGLEVWHRNWIGKKVFGLTLVNEENYTDPKGRVIKIKHGDDFDHVIFGRRRKMWYAIGDAIHNPIANIDTYVQRVPKLDSFSIAASVKKATKTIINRFLGVDDVISQTLDADTQIDGILYGHSHMGGIRHSKGGKLILNDGCCTEHVQAMVHDCNGTFALITWHKDRMDIEEESGNHRTVHWKDIGINTLSQDPRMFDDLFTQQADRLIRILYRLAPPKDRQMAIQSHRASKQDDPPSLNLPVDLKLPAHPFQAEQRRSREKALNRKRAALRPSSPTSHHSIDELVS